MTSQEDIFATLGVDVQTYRTELISLYVILRLIINIIDLLFLNSRQKSQWVHMSIPLRSGVRGPQRLPSFEIL